jgi:hypothetical protein
VDAKGSTVMNAILGVSALLLVFVGFILWECCGWISARAELVREQARKIKLENDKVEAARRPATLEFTQDTSGLANHS